MVAVFIKCAPMGAPRQSSSDRWKQRPVVMRYRAYKDEIRRQVLEQVGEHGADDLSKCTMFTLSFYLPFPKSYGKNKRILLESSGHNEKPDIDNLIKGVFDTICEDDKHIKHVTASKYWQSRNSIAGIEICGS
jgi:Holliday junction resolvase RusA-like endonuclease